MTFETLAQYFERLESTSSRLALIDILSELFKATKAEDIKQVCYLLQGRVAPFYEATEIGMSDKLVASSIARAYGTPREEVLKEYGKVGDLGKVAQYYVSHPELPPVIPAPSPVIPAKAGIYINDIRTSDENLAANAESDSASAVDSGSRPGMTGQGSTVTVGEVFETLRQIAQANGEGTVEFKVSTLAGLLQKTDPVSAKHLVRIPLGVSRLGIGDPTVLDGFAQAKLGDRKQRKLLEGAYNKVSDLGLIGQTLWEKGLEGVQRLDVTVGRPIRSQLAERISDPKLILEKFGGEMHCQQKWDGFRTQLHKQGNLVRIFSRNLEETTHMFPELIEGVLNQVKADSAILDAEAVAYNPASEEFLPFQETTKRRRKYGIDEAAKQLPLKAFVFDVMYIDGKSLMEAPLRYRLEQLKKIVTTDEILVPQPGEFVKDEKRLNELFQEALTKGLEGLIVKRPDSLYEAGARNFNWIKLKRHSNGPSADGLKDTIDCVILGYIFGRGKRAGFGAGALLVGVYDQDKDEFVTVSKIGTGLTDEEWREIKIKSEKLKVTNKPARVNSLITPSVWVEPRIVIEVLADEITRSPLHTAGKDGPPAGGEAGYALRFPRLVNFRDEDKKPEDATTVKELIQMYESQYALRR